MDIQATKLLLFSISCLTKIGVPQDEADLISKTMLNADARGIHSHGFMRLPVYVRRIQKGLVRSEALITTLRDEKAIALLDGNGSMGQIVGKIAMELAMEKAKKYGVGMVSVQNSNHFGIAAGYAMMASMQGMIGIVMSNTTPLMPPTGGAEKVLGNNPLAIAAPTDGRFPLLLDMALSNVAFGKIVYAKTMGESIPEGWGADREGNTTTDPADVVEGGFVLPLGGPKGFGLALMIELLTGVLSGGVFSKMIPSFYDFSQKQEIAHFMIAIQISSFMEVQRFREQASTLGAYVKSAVRASGVEELYLPGEIEFLQEEERMKNGIVISEHVLAELNQLADSLGVPALYE